MATSPFANTTFANTTTLIFTKSAWIKPEPLYGPLYLPVKGADPDPFGISKVNGYYGPGTWTGWFLTILTSWIRLSTKPHDRVDSNAYLYVFMMNWAAGDLIWRTEVWKKMLDDGRGTSDSDKQLGRIAAAFMMTWWGIFFTALPMIIRSIYHVAGRRNLRRTMVLYIGSVFPSFALSHFAFTLRTLFISSKMRKWPTAYVPIPALYWSGMEIETQQYILRLACFSGLSLLTYLCIASYLPLRTFLYANTSKRDLINRLGNFGFAFFSAVTLFLFKLYTEILYINFLNMPLGLVANLINILIIVFFPLSIIITFFGVFVVYIFKAYFHLGSSMSNSCFFMPCSPHQLSDMDQLFSLLGGLTISLGLEFGPPFVHAFKRRRHRHRRASSSSSHISLISLEERSAV
jgi:hypothetical protein